MQRTTRIFFASKFFDYEVNSCDANSTTYLVELGVLGIVIYVGSIKYL